jgi:hypothetical protein
MKAISEISIFKGLTKDQVNSFVEHAKKDIESGNVNALEVYTIFKTFEELQRKLKPMMEDYIMHDIEHEEEIFTRYGFDIEKAEVGVKYDFSKDETWNSYQRMIDDIRERQKEREKQMKAIREPQINADTGEIMQPAIKKSKSFIKIKRV